MRSTPPTPAGAALYDALYGTDALAAARSRRQGGYRPRARRRGGGGIGRAISSMRCAAAQGETWKDGDGLLAVENGFLRVVTGEGGVDHARGKELSRAMWGDASHPCGCCWCITGCTLKS